jgi:hypothetical protein
MSDVEVGKLIGESEARDAIHVAIAPVQALVALYPGTHVGLFRGKATKGVRDPIGIVDPFLPQYSKVEADQWFWLFLYPRTITSLRHNWAHPAFPEPASTAITSREQSEQWLREFCSIADCPGYETVMRLIKEGKYDDGEYAAGRMDSEYMHFDGSDAHGEIPAEFWVHVENVLGHPATVKPSYFSCSC